MLQFGPLIRLWTLRFESKHSYFKLSAGSCFPPKIQVDRGTEFHSTDYKTEAAAVALGFTP